MRVWGGLTIVFSLALLAAGCGQPEFAEAARSYALECTAANGYPVNPFTDQVVCSFSNPVVFFAPHPDDETLGMGGAILAAAALSFIGLGSQPPMPEWGRMLSEGRDYLRDAWWISTFPGIAIMLTVLGVNMLGDGLRDVLDPRLRI